jgi:TatA/E family protein of Tat protein translocase
MNLGLPEMIFIFLVALLIFGPRKLPEIGRQIGKAMNEFKKASNEFKAQIEGEMRNLELEEQAKREPAPQILPPEGSVAQGASSAEAVARHDPDAGLGEGSVATHEVAAHDGINSVTTHEVAAHDAALPPAESGEATHSQQAKAGDV